jgi:hypothetical protein
LEAHERKALLPEKRALLDEFLRHVRASNGINPFDRRAFDDGPKNIDDLASEVIELEVRIFIDELLRPCRHALTLALYGQHGDYWLRERFRERNGKRFKRFALQQSSTETRRRDKTVLEEVRKSIEDEYGIPITLAEVKEAANEGVLLWRYAKRLNLPSSVYWGGWQSHTEVQPVHFDLARIVGPHRPWTYGRWLDDAGTRIWDEWDHDPMETEYLRRAIASASRRPGLGDPEQIPRFLLAA